MNPVPPLPRELIAAPLYQQVKASLVQRLSSGEWLPGDFLPSEMSLADEYKVSQGTIRKAMNALTRDKVLARHQGKGTSVAVLNESSAMFRFFTLVDEHGERVFPDSTVCGVHKGAASPVERKALCLPPAASVVRLERIRFITGQPVINEYITLPCPLFAEFEMQAERIPNALYELYAGNYKITIVRADEHVRAVVADSTDAERLGIAPGHPLLMTTRVAYALQGTPIEYRISRINTDTYEYLSMLK